MSMDNAIKDELIDIALLAAIQGLPADLTKRILAVAIRCDNLSKTTNQAVVKPAVSLQPNLLHGAKSPAEIDAIIKRWINRQVVGNEITSTEACNWIEHESGVILTHADRQKRTTKDSALWRRRVSDSLLKLKNRGFLTVIDPVDGERLSRGHYIVVKLP